MSISRMQNDEETARYRKWEAEIRADERERCAKAIEADRDETSKRVGMLLSESCIYDICAATVRRSMPPNGSATKEGT